MEIDVTLAMFPAWSQPVDSLEHRLVGRVEMREREEQRCPEFAKRNVEHSGWRASPEVVIVGLLGAKTRVFFGSRRKNVARYFVPIVVSDR